MVVLCLIWGLAQVILKMAAADISPLMQIALRSGVAAVLVVFLMFIRRERLSIEDGTWRPGLLVAGLFALEFFLIGEGLRYTSASHMTVLLYTAPIFAALGLHLLMPSERLSRAQWFGIGLAFTGVAIAFLLRPNYIEQNISATDLLYGDLLSIGAGIAWAATTVAVRCSRLAQVSAAQTLLYQLAGAFFLLTAAAFLLEQTTIEFTALTWGSLIFQSLVVCFASYLAWFWLLKHYSASQLGVFSFLTPIFGVALGVSLLGEQLEISFIIGAAFVIVGLILVSASGWLKHQITRK
ncbi:MAG: DMT family transporter [Oxalobacteraceae bacterium]|jgi:drug/metabolite transporter (DMT)-like permease|nr:DMT family transporter [Oxalobacteraceae bacterium]